MNKANAAAEIFRRFRALPESGQIATRFAIAGLMRVIAAHHPQTVLELGAGLGTLSTAIVHAGPPRRLAVIERDSRCQLAWDDHVRFDGAGTALLRMTDWPLAPFPADLLVVDDWLPVRYSLVEPCLGRRALVFFEGNRVIERAIVREGLRAANRRVAILNRRPWDRSKGFWLFRADATAWEQVSWAVWTLAGRVLDLLVCGPVLGVQPGWRRRNSDQNT